MKIFIHGWESSNQGTKSIFFRERYPDMIIPNFTGNLEQRMEKLDDDHSLHKTFTTIDWQRLLVGQTSLL